VEKPDLSVGQILLHMKTGENYDVFDKHGDQNDDDDDANYHD